MKMSEMRMEDLLALSDTQKWSLCCSGVADDGESADAALLLGSLPRNAVERSHAAAALYRAGRVPLIIPSGGVLWEYRGEERTEAEIMKLTLCEDGVPGDAVVLENEARTTQENMICGSLQMMRAFRRIPDSVIIVTSLTHLRRSLALAKALLPRKIRISGCPAMPALPRDEWLKDPDNLKHLTSEIRFHKQLVDRGDTDDFELAL